MILPNNLEFELRNLIDMDSKKQPDFSNMNVEETIKYFESKGATRGQKTGSILMPVSKGMREAMQKDTKDKVQEVENPKN
jgi:hypothetical protein